MNLIDKYTAEVGKHLPRRQHADIEAEIRSTLEDMLEERKQGQTQDEEALIVALLKEYGSPREVAATYKTHQYLIGPRLFPTFETVLRIVLAVVAGASLIGLGFSLTKTGWTGPEFAAALGQWFGGLISSLIGAFGNIALIFAIIERTQAANRFEKEVKEWDPKALSSEPDPDRIDLPDHIATIIFTVLGLVIFNLYPNVFSIRFVSDGTWVTIPILTAAFLHYLPWMNIMGLLQIVFNGFMVGQQEWKPATRILGILMDVAGMILAVIILRTPGIFGVTSESLAGLGITEAADEVSRLFHSIPTIVITVIVIVTAIKVVKTLIRLFTVKSKSPYVIVK